MKKYLLSFTTGSFMLNETQKIASLYLKHKNWKIVDQQIFEKNVLQKNKLSTKKRQLQEIKKRLFNLSDEAIKELVESDLSNKEMVMLLAMIKTYRFIFEFIIEVIRPKWIRFDDEILDSDYDRFVNEKSELDTNLVNLSDSTKAKIKQVLFRILAEAGLIDSVKRRRIVQPYVSEHLVELIVKENPEYLKAFLFSDDDIEKYKEKYNNK